MPRSAARRRTRAWSAPTHNVPPHIGQHPRRAEPGQPGPDYDYIGALADSGTFHSFRTLPALNFSDQRNTRAQRFDTLSRMTTALPIAGVFLERSALATGFLAAAIAVGGFIGRALGQLDGARGDELQLPTTVGGTFGLCLGCLLLVIDAIAG